MKDRLLRHKRALVRASLTAFLLVPPIGYLAYVNFSDPLRETASLALIIPPFLRVANEGNAVLNQDDLFERVSLVLLLRQSDEETLPTADILQKIVELKAFSKTSLENPHPYDTKPQTIQWIVINERRVKLGEPFDLVLTGDAWEKLNFLPLDPLQSTLVFIGNEALVQRVLAIQDNGFMERARSAMQRLTSKSYLSFYVTQQTLMWRRARNYARGITEQSD